jgi:hypothetical protein
MLKTARFSGPVAAKSAIYTDALLAYWVLGNEDFAHQTIDHAERHVDGQIHTNGMENFGACSSADSREHTSPPSRHLFRFVDEQVLRYNNRVDMNDGDRLSLL